MSTPSPTASITTAAASESLRERHRPSSLQTPVSASYPSELRSPHPGAPAYLKKEDDLKTPITPPPAYLSFLKTLSPDLLSPATTATSSKFNFDERSADKTLEGRSEDPASSEGSSGAQPAQPSLYRQTSSDSTMSTSSVRTAKTTSTTTTSGSEKLRPQTPRIVIPPSPFAKPASAKLSRRLMLPQSPFSPVCVRSPMSARSAQSPYSTSALTATPWSATFSPREPEATAKGKAGKVCVRQVVTRTVTYCKTPLDPAPKGKRRKLEESDVS